MAKILLVDTNFSSGPIYAELIALGHEVHVVGGNPLDCLAKIAPNYWEQDYSDTDALGALIKEQEFDYVVPGCTDRSYESCVAINDGRFPGIDNAVVNKAINNKGAFRRLAEQLGLPVPKTQEADLRTLRWPLIVKPVDSFSGKGMTIIENEDAHKLHAAIKTACDASPSGNYLIEDFVDGQLHSHTAFLQNGRVLQDFIVQEDHTANPFVVDTSCVVPNAPAELFAELRKCAEALARELRLVDGLLHTQFISNPSGFWLIELTRRCPGDLYSQLIELTTGYRYARSYLLPFLGQRVAATTALLEHHPIMRHTVTVMAEQNLAHLRFKCSFLLERWVPLSLVGDPLKASPYSRIGILFCRCAGQQDLESIYDSTLQRNLYEVCA